MIVSNDKLAQCPCGEVPTKLEIQEGDTFRWRRISGNCCGEWEIEARVNTLDKDADNNQDCIESWNKATRSKPHEDAQNVIDMLILCGEEECRDVKGYPQKLRALIDGLIKLRAENKRLRKDAERYRWLRDYSAPFEYLRKSDIAYINLDNQVDKAMKAQEG